MGIYKININMIIYGGPQGCKMGSKSNCVICEIAIPLSESNCVICEIAKIAISQIAKVAKIAKSQLRFLRKLRIFIFANFLFE